MGVEGEVLGAHGSLGPVVHAEARGGARFSRWAGRGRGRAAAPCAASAPRGGPAPPSPWEQPQRPGLRLCSPASVSAVPGAGVGRAGDAAAGGRERTRCGSRKTARLPGASPGPGSGQGEGAADGGGGGRGVPGA